MNKIFVFEYPSCDCCEDGEARYYGYTFSPINPNIVAFCERCYRDFANESKTLAKLYKYEPQVG